MGQIKKLRKPSGRRISLSSEQLKIIIELTQEDELSRKEIARIACTSPKTVWVYQKKFELI